MNNKKTLEKYLEEGTKGSKASLEALELIMGGPLTLGGVIASHRKCEELTQTELASKLGITKQRISDIENDRSPISVELAVKLSVTLEGSTHIFVTLALQALVDRAGLDLSVKVS